MHGPFKSRYAEVPCFRVELCDVLSSEGKVDWEDFGMEDGGPKCNTVSYLDNDRGAGVMAMSTTMMSLSRRC